MEKYEAPKMEVINMQDDVVIACTGCPNDCPDNWCTDF